MRDARTLYVLKPKTNQRLLLPQTFLISANIHRSMSRISWGTLGSRTKIAIAVVLIITISSIGLAIYFAPAAPNTYDIQCLTIGDDGMGPHSIRVVGPF